MAATMELCENNTYDHYNRIKELIEEAELRAINRHKYYLSQQQGEDVGFDAAAKDWFENFSEVWRERRHQRMLEMQREEIKRYKWIQSERARKDLGRSAVEDWIHNFAADWRMEWEQTYNEDDEAIL